MNVDFFAGYFVGCAWMIAWNWWRNRTPDNTPKMYRIEGGPADTPFLAVYPDGMRMFCANAGTLPVEDDALTWADAQRVRSQDPY